jgi:O-glycosyl hydrolase
VFSYGKALIIKPGIITPKENGLRRVSGAFLELNDNKFPHKYTPRAHYYVFKQLFKFVKPGFQRIDISTKLEKMTISAFYDTVSGTMVITGKNDSSRAQKMDCILKDIIKASSLKYYYSDAAHNFACGSDVPVTNQTFSKLIPAFCVFTLVSQ